MRDIDVINEARDRLDDTAQEYLWSQDAMKRWLTEALFEAGRRSRIVVNSLETVSIVIGTARYDMPTNMFQILRGKLANESAPLIVTSYKVMDEDCPGWETDTGTPTHIITDMGSNSIVLYPIPTTIDTLTLMGSKDPETIEDVPARYHYGLVDWICYRALSKRDQDTYDPKRAAEYLSMFEEEFGTRSSAKDEIFNMRQRPFSNFDGHY